MAKSCFRSSTPPSSASGPLSSVPAYVNIDARYFRWLSKPPTLHSFSKSSVYLQKFVLPILVNKNAKFRVYNPMIRKTDSTEAIMVANNSTWRERCVWAYTLEKDKGGPIYMIDMDGDQGEAK